MLFYDNLLIANYRFDGKEFLIRKAPSRVHDRILFIATLRIHYFYY